MRQKLKRKVQSDNFGEFFLNFNSSGMCLEWVLVNSATVLVTSGHGRVTSLYCPCPIDESALEVSGSVRSVVGSTVAGLSCSLGVSYWFRRYPCCGGSAYGMSEGIRGNWLGRRFLLWFGIARRICCVVSGRGCRQCGRCDMASRGVRAGRLSEYGTLCLTFLSLPIWQSRRVVWCCVCRGVLGTCG